MMRTTLYIYIDVQSNTATKKNQRKMHNALYPTHKTHIKSTSEKNPQLVFAYTIFTMNKHPTLSHIFGIKNSKSK